MSTANQSWARPGQEGADGEPTGQSFQPVVQRPYGAPLPPVDPSDLHFVGCPARYGLGDCDRYGCDDSTVDAG